MNSHASVSHDTHSFLPISVEGLERIRRNRSRLPFVMGAICCCLAAAPDCAASDEKDTTYVRRRISQ
jgi:hypothetical protein